MLIAVESGDIVHATQLDSVDYKAVMSVLEEQLSEHAKRFGAKYEIFRGDAYQVYYPDASNAFRASLLNKLKLLHCFEGKPVRLTQALAFGPETPSTSPLSKNMGEVFISSGRLLETTRRADISLKLPEDNAALLVIEAYLNHHLAGLTQKQAEVVHHYFYDNYPEQHVIADKLNMTRQNVAAHLKRGAADLLKNSIAFFTQYCEGSQL